MTDPYKDIAYVRKRYRAARQRALYWSGNPSFSARRYSTRRHTSGPADDQYRLALDDMESLADIIVGLGGKRPKPYDPKERFHAAFYRLLGVPQLEGAR